MSSQNPFFSQDPVLSQIDCLIVPISNHTINTDEVHITDYSSWVEKVINGSCCSKSCLNNINKESLLQTKLQFASLSKNQQELVLLSLLQSFRTEVKIKESI